MVYRYVPKEKRLRFRKFISSPRLPKKHIHIIAAILAILCALIIIGGNITSYSVYVSSLEMKLNKTIEEKRNCEISLSDCNNSLEYCEKELKEKLVALSSCENLRLRYKIEKDEWKSNYTKLEIKHEICKKDYEECKYEYKKLKKDYDNLKSDYKLIFRNYRKYVCCIAKIGKDVDVLYWSMENKEITCSTTKFEGSNPINVSELGC